MKPEPNLFNYPVGTVAEVRLQGADVPENRFTGTWDGGYWQHPVSGGWQDSVAAVIPQLPIGMRAEIQWQRGDSTATHTAHGLRVAVGWQIPNWPGKPGEIVPDTQVLAVRDLPKSETEKVTIKDLLVEIRDDIRELAKVTQAFKWPDWMVDGPATLSDLGKDEAVADLAQAKSDLDHERATRIRVQKERDRIVEAVRDVGRKVGIPVSIELAIAEARKVQP